MGCVAGVELLERLCLALPSFMPTPRVLPAEPASQADSSGPARLTSGAATLHHIWPTIWGHKRNSPRQPKCLPNRSPALAWPPAFIQDGFLKRGAAGGVMGSRRAPALTTVQRRCCLMLPGMKWSPRNAAAPPVQIVADASRTQRNVMKASDLQRRKGGPGT